MKIIVAGGREFIPAQEHKDWLINALKVNNATEVVCGMARGADMHGYNTAKELGIPVKEFAADWVKFGKEAGRRRNKEMADYADMLIVFPGGVGTNDMIRQMRAKKKPIVSWLAGQIFETK